MCVSVILKMIFECPSCIWHKYNSVPPLVKIKIGGFIFHVNIMQNRLAVRCAVRRHCVLSCLEMCLTVFLYCEVVFLHILDILKRWLSL